MKRRIHMCVSIQGLLDNHKHKKITILEDDNGKKMTDTEARIFLAQCLSEGKRVLPTSDDCEGFSYQTGCPGHEIKESTEIKD